MSAEHGITRESFEERVREHLAGFPGHEHERLAAAFAREGIVHLGKLLPPDLAAAMNEEAVWLLENHGRRREVVLPTTGNTPRSYRSVARDSIARWGGIIPCFFHSEAIRGFLAEVAGERLHKVPYEPEEFIVNALEAAGDTHGWHFDDYSYALVWVAEAPDPMLDARVEYIPGVRWNKEDPEGQLKELLATRPVRSLYVEPGTCYLMQTRKTLHRVSPLADHCRRTAVIFTYANDHDLRDDSITHETMEAIYEPEIA